MESITQWSGKVYTRILETLLKHPEPDDYDRGTIKYWLDARKIDTPNCFSAITNMSILLKEVLEEDNG